MSLEVRVGCCGRYGIESLGIVSGNLKVVCDLDLRSGEVEEIEYSCSSPTTEVFITISLLFPS